MTIENDEQMLVFLEPRYLLGGIAGSGRRWTYKPLIRIQIFGREIVLEVRWRSS